MVVMHHRKVAVGVSSLFRPKVGLESAAWMSLQQAYSLDPLPMALVIVQSKSVWVLGQSKLQSRESNPNCVTGTGDTTGSKSGGYESPSPDRLVYLTSCLIGHQVDVQVKNGSVFSGIFHETNANEDFGIVLKMACLTNAASSRARKAASDFVSMAPSKTVVIPSYELVQILWTGLLCILDQFKVNETSFGVKSTFAEELHTLH